MKAQIIMVKLLLNCRFSKQNKGFVISLDTFFAILLLLGVISYLGIGMQPTEQPAIAITTQTNAKQILDDAITAMDNNGFIGEVLVDDSNELTTAQAQKIFDRLKQLLPSNMDLNIKITRFEPVDDLGSAASTCRGSFEFDKCFKTNPETVSIGIMLPQNNEVFYGNQLFMKRQPYIKGIAPNTCILESQLAGKKTIQNTSKALFDEAPIITTKVSVTDNAGNLFSAANKMQCFDSEDGIGNNEAAIVTMQEKSGIRPPVSVMTVIDRSYSMGTYDMNIKATATGTFNNGTCQPYPVWVPGKAGNALNFNGIYSYVTMDGNKPSLQLTSDLTIEFWAKPTNVSTPNRQNPICKSYGAEFCLTMEPDGTLSYYHGSAGYDTSPYMSAQATNMFTNNNWVHVVIVRNNSARTITFYKNAAVVSIGSWSSGYDPVTSIYPLRIGWAYTNDFNGIIDEVRLYNRQLSAAEISQSYQLGLNGQPSNITSGLVGYWAFNESTGSTAADSSGTGNNGTLRGFYPTGSACQYNNGTSAYWTPLSTNCPTGKTQVSAHTNQKTALTYDIGSIRPVLGSNDRLDFLASPSCSSSLCTSMRLWIKRPDGVIESDWSDYYENVYNPAQYAGNNYDANVWSAGNCNYYIYLRQYLNTNNSVSGNLSGSGTHDGQYFPACNCYWNGSTCVDNCTGPPYLSCSIGSVTCNGGTPCSWNGEACAYSWPDAPPYTACSSGSPCGFGSPCIWNGSTCVYSKAPATPQTACGINSVSCNGGSRGAVYCSNFENWQKVSEYNFNPAYDKLFYLYWNISYNTYSMPPGQCYAPKFQIRHVNGVGVNDYNWPATTSATGYCGSGGNGSCTIWVANNNPISGPFAPTGKYELWGWSDAPLSSISAYIYAYQSWGIIFGNLSRTDSISGGTCSGSSCYSSTKYFPGTPTVTNCPSMNENLSRVASLPLADWKVVNSLSVPPNQKRVKVVMDYWDYSGGCNGGALGFQNPISGPNVLNWWYVWPKKNQYYGNGCFSVNDSASGCSDWSSGTTMPAGDYNVLGWADETTSYKVNWYIQRIGAAVNAAKSFLNNANWKAGDMMGIVSYASTATTDASLTDFINPVGKATLEAALDSLNPGGETNIGDAIAASTTALVSSPNTKFTVLMSDGQANKPDPAATAVAYAIQKADEARTAGITVYTIGFGADVAATDLKDIAKDPCNEYLPDGKCKAGSVRLSGGTPKYPDCFINNDANTLTIDPAKHCGRYYYAGDPQTLQQVYDLIAKEIGIALSNVKIVVNPVSGELLCKCGNVGCATECDLLSGDWTTLPITFNANLGGTYAAQSFKARIDCDSSYCEKKTVDFPPIGAYPGGTFMQYGETAYEWGNETSCDANCDCNLSKCVKTIDFLFRDLGIKFTGGTINGNKVSLDFNIQNSGLAAITPSNLQIGFYKDKTSHLHADGIASSQCQGIFPPNNCIVDGTQDYNLLWQGSAIGAGSAVSFQNMPVNGAGYIQAVISGAKECPLHNQSTIYCLTNSKVYYFKVEYSAWVK